MSGVLLVLNKIIPAFREFAQVSKFKTIFKQNSARIT